MGISSTQTFLKYIYHCYNGCPTILLDAKIMAVIFGSFILMITCKTMSITKVHVNRNPKIICQKNLNLNGKLDIGRDTIKITNKSYAYCWEELCTLQKSVENECIRACNLLKYNLSKSCSIF